MGSFLVRHPKEMPLLLPWPVATSCAAHDRFGVQGSTVPLADARGVGWNRSMARRGQGGVAEGIPIALRRREPWLPHHSTAVVQRSEPEIDIALDES